MKGKSILSMAVLIVVMAILSSCGPAEGANITPKDLQGTDGTAQITDFYYYNVEGQGMQHSVEIKSVCSIQLDVRAGTYYKANNGWFVIDKINAISGTINIRKITSDAHLDWDEFNGKYHPPSGSTYSDLVCTR